MSKQIGIIKLKGNLNGVSFYQSGGSQLARMANGPDKNRINNDPSYVRTRENNSEFGGSAAVGKALRLAFAESLRTMADRYFTARLVRVFKDICSRGNGVRGERAINVSSNPFMLDGLEFNRHKPYSSLCTAPGIVMPGGSRNEATLAMGTFQPSVYIHAPSGATHFRIIFALGSLSDYEYDASVRGYAPVNPQTNSLSAVAYGSIEALNNLSVDVTLTAAFAGSPTIDATTSVMAAIGIEFYQRINTVDYLLAQSNGMQIVDVF